VKNDDQPIKPKTVTSDVDTNKIDDQSAFYPTPKPRFDYANPLEESPMSTPRVKGANASPIAKPNANPLEESPMTTSPRINVKKQINEQIKLKVYDDDLPLPTSKKSPNDKSKSDYVNAFDEQPIKPKTVNYGADTDISLSSSSKSPPHSSSNKVCFVYD
jgi:hypothetical protein